MITLRNKYWNEKKYLQIKYIKQNTGVQVTKKSYKSIQELKQTLFKKFWILSCHIVSWLRQKVWEKSVIQKLKSNLRKKYGKYFFIELNRLICADHCAKKKKSCIFIMQEKSSLAVLGSNTPL